MRYLATLLITLLVVALHSGSLLCLQCQAAPRATPSITLESLRELSNDELLKVFESDAVSAGPYLPTSLGIPGNRLIRVEIVHRGSEIVPQLSAALKKEVALIRPESSGQPALAMFNLLSDIGDPQAVQPLLEIVETSTDSQDGEHSDSRALAISALEKLTFVCFHKVRPHEENYLYAVQHPSALKGNYLSPADYPKVVQLYRDWLAGEGKNPADWLPLARKNARALLESDNLDNVYCAASFLTGPGRWGEFVRPFRDDLPERTMDRLVQVLRSVTPVPNGQTNESQYQGKLYSIATCNWFNFITAYGPRARPYASTLIRYQNEAGLDNWPGYQELGKVGGKEIVDFCFSALPAIDKKVDEIRKDPDLPKSFAPYDWRARWLDSQGICRGVINRWAGQRFDTDDARLAWWQANKAKSPEQWLRDSLPVTAERADTSKIEDVIWLFRQLFPDAPYGTDEVHTVNFQAKVWGKTPLPFRKKWFEQHQNEFIYDANTATFRLPDTPSRE